MRKHYEAPDLLELGEASKLTLGTNGGDPDNCGCNVKGGYTGF